MESVRAACYGDNALILGCFEVGGQVYALDVSLLREVVRWQPVTPLPDGPTLIEGVIDLRGDVVPVVDLGRALGGSPVEPALRARIAIAEVDGLVVGLAVDAAIEVFPVDSESLEQPPELMRSAGCEMARAVLRRPGQPPIFVLSLDRLIESVRGSAAGVLEASA